MEDLNQYLGKCVCLTNGQRSVFGMLETNGQIFGVAGNGFQSGVIKETTKVEVDETRNLCRLVIRV